MWSSLLGTRLVDGRVAPEGVEDAGQLPGEGYRGDATAASHSDGSCPRLQGPSGSTSAADLYGPCCLAEHPADGRRPGFRDAQSLLSLRARALPGRQPEIGLDLVRGLEPRDVVDSGHETHRSRGPDARHGHQALTELVLCGKRLDALLGHPDPLV